VEECLSLLLIYKLKKGQLVIEGKKVNSYWASHLLNSVSITYGHPISYNYLGFTDEHWSAIASKEES
jgi:hypothetical protein